MKIHPIADLFPMMLDDELQNLAADIQANGLIQPIVVDDAGQVVDGRNRLAACKLAGVEPNFEKLNGRDPVAYIVSANLARRNLSKGQQAMALAIIYPEPERGRGKKDGAKKGAETSSFSYRRVQEARIVLRHSRKLAEDVIKGTTPLDEALGIVKDEFQEASSKEAKMLRLQKYAPDLGDRVADEKLSLDEAIALLSERERRNRETREAGKIALQNLPEEFSTRVVTIIAAIEAGEDLTIRPEKLDLVNKTYKQLLKTFAKEGK